MEPPQDKADADLDLSKLISFEKRQELYNVLHSEDPDHYSRLWFVGFMKFCGYTADEICNIIHDEAAWSDYDARMTFLQVQSIFRTGDRRSTSAGICTGRNCSIQIEEKKCQPLVKCNSANPCPDSVGEYCYIPFGEYHLPSADEKIRRAILCLIEHQIAKFRRQKDRINALRALLFSILFR
jgi:hypothetical protein